MKCSFQDELSKVSKTEGCRGFRPTITSNGMCYTFNGDSVNKIWRLSEVMQTFNNMFPQGNIQNEYFGGSEEVQGNINSGLKIPGYKNTSNNFQKGLLISLANFFEKKVSPNKL